ncbi:CocE/NonD family hydrolase [Gilvibacter sp.]|uniref:dienelactone hydrolase family protein n=1 Tax=Gilvibacter sp. TaxID=2729997 RepID=UPI0025C2CA78|nr:CocE/NonD family hydrolase [Gilvibacter sp.]NQX76136.1 dienelactone hydrolase family protein [Gilvibacter sp.]
MSNYFLAFLFFISISAKGQTSVADLNLDYGTYEVGYRYTQLVDNSRSYSVKGNWTTATIARPIPLSIWYPAKSTAVSTPMKVMDYMRVLKLEEEWEHLPDSLILNWFYYAPNAQNKAHLWEEVKAVKDQAELEGKYPVIVYAPSYGAASTENFTLCEYLASHGYVVIASPSRGAYNRSFTGGTLLDLETQARDIEFIVDALDDFNYVDTSRIATMGFSFGGISNVLASIRNKQIKANVSLDGSVKYQFKTLASSPFYRQDEFAIPFIHFSQKDIPAVVLEQDGIDPALNTDFEFYDRLDKAPAYQLKMLDLTHGNFSSFGVLFANRDQRQDKSDQLIMESYNILCEYSRLFLDAHVKKEDATTSKFDEILKSSSVSLERFSYQTKVNQTHSMSLAQFNELAAKQNYSDLLNLYTSLNLDQKFHQGDLNNLGLHLFFNPEFQQSGIAVLKFATELYPESANLFDSLGEAYFLSNQYPEATRAFERSLVLYPENVNAKNRLKAMKQ